MKVIKFIVGTIVSANWSSTHLVVLSATGMRAP